MLIQAEYKHAVRQTALCQRITAKISVVRRNE